MLKQRIDQDLKAAMLAGNKDLATTIRGLKSAILYAEIASDKRETGLNDSEITALLQKEAKKRTEAADLYQKNGANDQATKELAEKAVIDGYLPQQLSDEDLVVLVDEAIKEVGDFNQQSMGRVIGLVKAKAGASVDGARLAGEVKKRLGQ